MYVCICVLEFIEWIIEQMTKQIMAVVYFSVGVWTNV